ncbi:MAG TPA: glycerol-3-phosphate 1-O-acyltransferase PlsY [Terriglobales bacterium]|nr:glycerol-3-phosphate 1-O-acyltransferase PlsY [Terriglobales bacterium]
MPFYLATAVIAYLLGSIPFGYILVRIFRGQDVRESGSGNIGATNVARSSPALGALTLLLDATKGFLAVTAGSLIAVSAAHAPAQRPSPYTVVAVAAIFAVAGHMFPIWLKFRGGKGVATSVGVFLALVPKTLLLALALFVALVAVFRYVSLGSIIAAAAFPLIAYALHDYHSSPAMMAAMCAIAALIIIKHHENIRRLLASTESRLPFKRTQP